MTIEQLLECTTSELESLDDAKLEEYFSEVLKFTRPAAIATTHAAKATKAKKKKSDNEAQELFTKLGLDAKLMKALASLSPK